ncbi:hypothetical protein ZIOFF_002607 [Zingiber officinale]|uniref:Uncharacterized protein n=1 Tax=Zingiber officinale TaxID=94328 RepID=A0A8J5LW28_ZINOF|nr:hypothetical protein ZIOFF_002607 [Zingiber officinale]
MSFLTNVVQDVIELGAMLLNSLLYTVDDNEWVVLFGYFPGVLLETDGDSTHFIIPGCKSPSSSTFEPICIPTPRICIWLTSLSASSLTPMSHTCLPSSPPLAWSTTTRFSLP